MTDREARFRWLLRAYPKAYRAVREDEILATLLDAAPPEQRGPKLSDAIDVGFRGMQLRLAGARRHPLWVASVSVVAASVAAALALVAVSTPHPFVASGVPWLNDPVSSSYAHALTVAKPLPKPTTSAPPCRASQLEFMSSGSNEGGMQVWTFLDFRNSGPASCLLRGTPTVTAYSAAYPPLVGSPQSPADTQFFGEVADTPPGGTVTAELTDFEGCQGSANDGRTYNEMLLDLPDGGSVLLPIAYRDYCDPFGVSPFFTSVPQPTFYSFPTDVLRAHMRMPATVQHGTTLVYDIELSNPTRHRVAFSPCPVYEMSADKADAVAPAYFRLDCRGVPPLAPHHSRFFQMKLRVPSHGVEHNLWVYWKLVSLMAVASTWGHTAVT